MVQSGRVKQLPEARRKHAKAPPHPHYAWHAEQLHDFILFLADTGLRPDEANYLEHRDVEIVKDDATGERILEIEMRGKRRTAYSMRLMEGATFIRSRRTAAPASR